MNSRQIEVNKMLDLKIHDIVAVRDGFQCVRVPGGWIYYAQTTSESALAETFVPEPLRVDYDKQYLKAVRQRYWAGFASACAAMVIYIIVRMNLK